MNRRTFVKNSAMAAYGFAILPPASLFAADQKVKLAIIGTGLRGQNHLDNALRRSDVDIVAICDVDDRMLQMASDLIKKSGKAMPQIFKGDNYAYRKLLEQKNIDGILI